MQTAALIVAAGRGQRAGGGLPKQWRDLCGAPVAEYALRRLAAHPGVGPLVMVIHPDDAPLAAFARDLDAELVLGGETRRASVLAGLEALEGRADQVLIHDAARPGLSAALIDRVLAALRTHRAAAPALGVVDALWRGQDGRVSGVQDRSALFRAQTPQGFDLAAILAAHRNASGDVADDVEIARAAGLEVAIVDGDEENFKITQPQDFQRAARMIGEQMTVRMGNGYDVHRFGPGTSVVLCGVEIAHERSLQGHSDADVGMHALTDAIYGALAEGDIGQHFPPSDPQWKGAASDIFLHHAVQLAAERGFSIGNVDVTLICEYPKIGPHAQAMRAALAQIMGVGVDQVSVKATTSERLGFTGRGEGIAAQATALLVAS